MRTERKAAGEGATSPAADTAPSQAMPAPYTAIQPHAPPEALAVAILAMRYALPLPWAAIVAVAAGIGGGAK